MQNQILKALSIDNMIHSCYTHPTEIDVVISSGGFFGFFVIGVDKILKKLEQEKKLVIKRYSGSSVGAICSIFMACDVPSEEVIQIYEHLLNHKVYFLKLREQILRIIPPNAWERCTNKVFIYATEITWKGPRKVVFSEFKNNQELVDAALASSNMPFLVSPLLFYPFKNRIFIDGCFTSVLPIFPDTHHEQLLIKLYKIRYYDPYAFFPNDPSIEGLVVKGGVETDKFLSRVGHHNVRTLEWFNPKKQRKKNIKRIAYGGFFALGTTVVCWLIQNTMSKKNKKYCDS